MNRHIFSFIIVSAYCPLVVSYAFQEFSNEFDCFFSGSSTTSKHSEDSSETQTGSGHPQQGTSGSYKENLMKDNLFLDHIVDAVSKKLSQNPRPITENWKFYERCEPTASTDVQPENTAPPAHFNNPVCENDLNDSFDENQLLRFVPKRFRQKAKDLLTIFDERPDELTWDSAGVIYIDQTSIPNSNIFTLFPYLFRQKTPKEVIAKGFADFLKKVLDMKLEHLINCNIKSFVGKVDNIKLDKKETNTKWWLLT